ncbi:MAG: hypothetical protein L0387_26045 [Acidobacteria bacterium]|nr:hypothetical protein [Acidobacteriota bacterium]MCI0625063.1 hypothetical protein [Acidobacteriota bacterium]MCI0718462.1 hypothetical protein [Acidobacteriota bacterium]
MPENSNYDSNSKTLVIETKDFAFETMSQNTGLATIVRFRLLNPDVRPGDVLLVLTGSDVHFHGLIGRIDEGWAVATDHRSLLPLPTIH